MVWFLLPFSLKWSGGRSESEMTYSGAQTVDRRESKRIGVHVPINIDLPNTSSEISGRIQDISIGGIKVKIEITPTPFQIKDEVRFLVTQNYLNFQGQGEILWISLAGVTAGIKFTQLDKKTSDNPESIF